jgi:hypothetical protein
LINALISHAEDLEYRIHLRNEILRSGFFDALPTLPHPGAKVKESNGSVPGHLHQDSYEHDVGEEESLLSRQMEFFYNGEADDYAELVSRFRDQAEYDPGR